MRRYDLMEALTINLTDECDQKILEGDFVMKRKIFLILSFMLVFTLLVGCSTNEPASENPGEKANEEPQRKASVSFATSGQGGTFYVAGSGIAYVGSSEVEGLDVTAEVTRGVVENVRLMATNQTEMGFSYGSTAYNIQRGLGDFEGQKYEGLRAVASIHDGALNFITLQKNDIKTLDDLVGKEVSIGPKGSGSAAVSEQFLKSAGLFEKIDISNLSFRDSASALRDGHLDAFIIGGSTPIPVLVELEASHKIRFIPVDEERRTKFLTEYPYHVPYTILADGYPSLEGPVETVGYSVIWVAREDVPEWVINDMLEVMFSEKGKKYLSTVQRAFREMQPGIERFEKIDLPLHPGAEKYYKEAGLLK